MVIGTTKAFMLGKSVSFDDHTHNHLNIESSSEMNLDYGFKGGAIYLNYRGADGAISDYLVCNGQGTSLGSLIHSGNIGNYAAAKNHSHTMDNLSGVLSVSKGGTGVTSLDALKSALGVSSGGGKVYYTTISSTRGTTLYPGFEPKAIFICVYGSASVNGRNGFAINPSPRLLFRTEAGNTEQISVSWGSSSVTIGSGYQYSLGCIILGT